jgi:hypothetical protein
MSLDKMVVCFLMTVMVIAFLSLNGCATRQLTAEQEAQIVETCGSEHDCYVVKGEVWRKILKYFESLQGI